MKLCKNISKVFIFAALIVSSYGVYQCISIGNYERFAVSVAIVPVLLAPFLIKKIFHFVISEPLQLCYFLFVFLAISLGSVIHLYSKIWWFDNFVHYVSGILVSILALIFLKKRHLLESGTIWFNVLFILSFALAIGALWEFFEFGCDLVMKSDTQKVAESGVQDTMVDMIVAFLGSLTFIFYYLYQMSKAKVNRIRKLGKYL